MPDLINWDLFANPLNWLIVALMLAIGVWALHLVAASAGQMAFPLAIS